MSLGLKTRDLQFSREKVGKTLATFTPDSWDCLLLMLIANAAPPAAAYGIINPFSLVLFGLIEIDQQAKGEIWVKLAGYESVMRGGPR